MLKQGIEVHAYLDNWLFRADLKKQCDTHLTTSLELFQSMGWTINWDKSVLNPTQTVEFLGLHLDLARRWVALEEKFLTNMRAIQTFAQVKSALSLRQLSSIQSLITHIAPGGIYTQDPSSCGCRRVGVKLYKTGSTVFHWTRNIGTLWFVPPLQIPFPEVEMITNASTSGWGVLWMDKTVSGLWTTQELHVSYQMARDLGSPVSTSAMETASLQPGDQAVLLQQHDC